MFDLLKCIVTSLPVIRLSDVLRIAEAGLVGTLTVHDADWVHRATMLR